MFGSTFAVDNKASKSLIEYTFGFQGSLTQESRIFQGYQELSQLQRVILEDEIKKPGNVLELENYRELLAAKNISNSRRIIYIKGFRSPRDGGEGYFVVNRAGNHANSDGVIIIKSKADNIVFERLHPGRLNIRAFGAKGDGITDDTIQVQRVLDTKFDVYADNSTYTFLVGYSARQFKKPTPYRTALVVYSGQRLNLNGSAFKLKNNSNSSVIANEALLFDKTKEDSGLVLENIIIHGNVDMQKTTGISKRDVFSPTIYLANINNSKIENVSINDYYSSGLYITGRRGSKSRNIELDKISVNRGFGPGISISGDQFRIGELSVRDTMAFTERGKPIHYWGAHPNAMTAKISNSTINTISYKDCSWGFKLQDGSKNVHISKIVANGVVDDQAVKIQGMDDKRGYKPNENIIVDQILSSNNHYNGLYIIYNHNLRIKKYIGRNNGLAYRSKLDGRHLDSKNFYDVLIIKSDAAIDTIESHENLVGVLFSHENGTRTSKLRRFGEITIKSTGGSKLIYIKNSSNEIREVKLESVIGKVNAVVYFYGRLFSGNKNNNVNNIQVSKGIFNGNDAANVCRGNTSYHCRFIKVGDSTPFQIKNGKQSSS